MNERFERTTNDGYFSEQTAERLPSESQRRAELHAELKRINAKREFLQQELNGYLNSKELDELFSAEILDLNDARVKRCIDVMNEMDDLGYSAAMLRRTITRLDAGETLADIYRNIFG